MIGTNSEQFFRCIRHDKKGGKLSSWRQTCCEWTSCTTKKSWRHKKCPHVVHFNVPCDWYKTNLWHQKRYFEGSKKNLWVSTRKSDYINWQKLLKLTIPSGNLIVTMTEKKLQVIEITKNTIMSFISFHLNANVAIAWTYFHVVN